MNSDVVGQVIIFVVIVGTFVWMGREDIGHLIHRIAHMLHCNGVTLLDVDENKNMKVRCTCGREYWL